MRVLFIVKKREQYCHHGYHDTLGGLYNSARFVVDMLDRNGFTASLVQVNDNNDIDREVHNFRPDVAVIEALWVVPSKFQELIPLHPKVKWVVRVHSEMPFLSLEGMAIEWIKGYMKYPNVYVASNSLRATADVRSIVALTYGNFRANKYVIYLPNWYPAELRACPKKDDPNPYHLHIGCFGAIRPFKNQLIQALAAMKFAAEKRKLLRFHVNGTRCEQQGDSVLRNLRALFDGSGDLLIEHTWETHDQFLDTIAAMDASMSVSFSETFNIVSADAVTTSVPIVVSSEVAWASPTCYAIPTDTDDIVRVLDKVTSNPFKWMTTVANLRRLRQFDKDSVTAWKHFLSHV